MATKVTGHNKSITFQVDGAGSATTVPVISSSLTERVMLYNSTDTASSGKECYEAGILGADINAEAFVDSTALPNATAPGIVAGAKGVFTVSIGGTNPYSVHVIIESVGPRIPHNDLIKYTFRAKLDNSSGSYTRPS